MKKFKEKKKEKEKQNNMKVNLRTAIYGINSFFFLFFSVRNQMSFKLQLTKNKM